MTKNIKALGSTILVEIKKKIEEKRSSGLILTSNYNSDFAVDEAKVLSVGSGTTENPIDPEVTEGSSVYIRKSSGYLLEDSEECELKFVHMNDVFGKIIE